MITDRKLTLKNVIDTCLTLWDVTILLLGLKFISTEDMVAVRFMTSCWKDKLIVRIQEVLDVPPVQPIKEFFELLRRACFVEPVLYIAMQ